MRRAIELAGGKLAIPAEDRVQLSHGGDVGENLAAQATTGLSRAPRSASDSFSRPVIWAFMMRFSAARYSFRASNSWSTVPVT